MGEEKAKEKHIVFIGTKPFMNYVTSVIMQFTTNESDSVVIKARGKFINRAVDVAEVVRRKFLKDKKIEVEEIKIDSEEMENKEGKKTNVSSIEIYLRKK